MGLLAYFTATYFMALICVQFSHEIYDAEVGFKTFDLLFNFSLLETYISGSERRNQSAENMFTRASEYFAEAPKTRALK